MRIESISECIVLARYMECNEPPMVLPKDFCFQIRATVDITYFQTRRLRRFFKSHKKPQRALYWKEMGAATMWWIKKYESIGEPLPLPRALVRAVARGDRRSILAARYRIQQSNLGR